jgi:hypothetical protein
MSILGAAGCLVLRERELPLHKCLPEPQEQTLEAKLHLPSPYIQLSPGSPWQEKGHLGPEEMLCPTATHGAAAPEF